MAEETIESLKALLAETVKRAEKAEAEKATAEQTAAELNKALADKEAVGAAFESFKHEDKLYRISQNKVRISENIAAEMKKLAKVNVEPGDYTSKEIAKSTSLQKGLIAIGFGGFVELKSK